MTKGYAIVGERVLPLQSRAIQGSNVISSEKRDGRWLLEREMAVETLWVRWIVKCGVGHHSTGKSHREIRFDVEQKVERTGSSTERQSDCK